MDGQQLNSAHTGDVEWNALPTGNIERIEVIRGPASALYGGNAMGGVINFHGLYCQSRTETRDGLEL